MPITKGIEESCIVLSESRVLRLCLLDWVPQRIYCNHLKQWICVNGPLILTSNKLEQTKKLNCKTI